MKSTYAISLIANLKTGAPSPGDAIIEEIRRRFTGEGHRAIDVSSISEIRQALKAEISPSLSVTSRAQGRQTSGGKGLGGAGGAEREDDESRPAIVQFIGHGDAGVLYFDREPPIDAAGPPKEFHYLDSTPRGYVALKDLIKAPTEVFLIGCNVGLDVRHKSVESDGPTLLFALSQMWETHVWASRGDVSVRDFDPDTGLFEGTLVNSRGNVRREFLRAIRNRTGGRTVKDTIRDSLRESLEEPAQKVKNLWQNKVS
jgi:hypothetical protein